AFKERDARAFLQKSGLNIGPKLMDEVFKQIRIFDEAGLVRPITLNMVGLILDRYSIEQNRALRAKRTQEGLIFQYVRKCLNQSNTRDCSQQLLRNMITGEGTRTPKSIETLCNSTNLGAGSVIRCLRQLEHDGLVRSIDKGQKLWEISHDFVARVLD